ncbi:uncharacterized protein LOC119637589 isoform X1 [Glossina fuscipes]|uniref:Uncharacterized protein LOC119637589 isoform X1 n=1 Tax=Glossina fuscipes TaxID=7396 RepID=A0A9C6DSI3_9MUSC|nr:uncharacterized protein LOC119637589 isoform X1 [Glossina fuscipes]XP_037889651.1 uncharacterized protein LOC119637589 isoform X1 [Glossina fuscipes]XP_037889652.1 uncharacterized protein LOC119637589 isoform X1 [Glossina fuscipes]XP_037889654.1 uncharacterized protein LOC119637589 isoform X1 [Glossina fuscipes]XP_037889655.1 uncharacterized protein LOC119637589 isoform X1 [Glossina fuscipes]XP_037889656.1 uncharacterized protein LOC119637589 isoform X1 [Glossina fuscipes]KAI9581723.1 hypo
MTSRNGKKISALRTLWIPGKRKCHPKGYYDTTNKKISYPNKQKKSQVWSLGGSTAQRDLLQADPDTSLLDGPSSSGLTSIACVAAAATTTVCADPGTTNDASNVNTQNIRNVNSSIVVETEESLNSKTTEHTPTSPNSTASTLPLVSPTLSPFDEQLDKAIEHVAVTKINNNYSINPSIMPTKSYSPITTIVTATTTAEIMEKNRFSLLSKELGSNEFDINTLPSPPKTFASSNENLNSSPDTTLSTVHTESPHRDVNIQNGSIANAQQKQTANHYKQRNHNNNQGDVNSIESITDDVVDAKMVSTLQEETQKNDPDVSNLMKSKKKRKKKHVQTKELDQLDGVLPKANTNDTVKEEDEKVVKCLYYTLMCCDCTIS